MPSSPVAHGLVRVSTDTVSSSNRLAYWADWVCAELIQAQIRTARSDGSFTGSIERAQLPELDVCRVRSTAQSVARTPVMAAGAAQEHILVNLQRQGVSYLSQDGKTAKLRPGDMAIYSSARPYQLDFDSAFDQTVLILPAAKVH